MNNANQDNLWDQLTIQGKKDKKLDSNLRSTKIFLNMVIHDLRNPTS